MRIELLDLSHLTDDLSKQYKRLSKTQIRMLSSQVPEGTFASCHITIAYSSGNRGQPFVILPVRASPDKPHAYKRRGLFVNITFLALSKGWRGDIYVSFVRNNVKGTDAFRFRNEKVLFVHPLWQEQHPWTVSKRWRSYVIDQPFNVVATIRRISD